MRLDMSLPEQKDAPNTKNCFGLEKQEGEFQKNPDKKPDAPEE